MIQKVCDYHSRTHRTLTNLGSHPSHHRTVFLEYIRHTENTGTHPGNMLGVNILVKML